MKIKKDAPWIDRICAFEPCSKPFRTQNPEQKYHCRLCRNRQHQEDCKARQRGETVEPRWAKKPNTYPITYTTLLMIVQADVKGESMKMLAMETARDEALLKAVLCKLKATGRYDQIKARMQAKSELPSRSNTGQICTMPKIRQDQLLRV